MLPVDHLRVSSPPVAVAMTRCGVSSGGRNRAGASFRSTLLIDPAINLRQFFNPQPAVCVFQSQDLFKRPVQVVRKVGYLLVKLV
jgi:hypothetical protein